MRVTATPVFTTPQHVTIGVFVNGASAGDTRFNFICAIRSSIRNRNRPSRSRSTSPPEASL